MANSPVTYDGTAKSAAVSGSVAGSASNILTGGAATQPGAGTYAVTADFTPTDTANYNSLTTAAAGNFVINKATPTVTVGNSPVTYDGTAKSAAVSGSVAGAASSILTGGAATQTNAGTYAVTADFTPTDTVNYNSLTGASAGNFVIDKVTPTLSVTNSPVTYDGTAKSATVSGSVAGTASSILTGGAATQTNAGTYAVAADFTPTDTTNYASLTAASAGNFVIDKVTPTVSVTNSPVTYDATAKSATVSGSVAGSASNILTGGAATQTSAGTYAVIADFTPTDTTNYASLTAASAGNFIISKTTLTITANNGSKTYGQTTTFAGSEFTPTGLGSGDTVTSVTLASAGASASADLAGSPYSIVPSAAVFGAGSASNYNIAYANGTLTVGSATLTVTANDASKSYGSENPALAATYGGYVNSENSSAITGTPSLSTAATATSPVGTYTITPAPGTLSRLQITHSLL